MQIPELSEDDYETLLLMCGFAIGSALRCNDRKLHASFLRVANTLNKNNPNFKPFTVPEEGKQIAGNGG